ncbi:MAG: prolyl oligopeptidase family serine peptidase [Treponema sp.]|jgi:predicted peptidase|nr:prolyl oligopeptidase family serine peptidase [Treponema sp.]
MKVINALLAGIIAASMIACASTGGSQNGNHIKSVTAIGVVFGDGEKLAAVAVEYDAEIAADSLDINDYSVEGNTITAVYVNSLPQRTEQAKSGNYVLLELAVAAPNVESSMPGHGGGGQRPERNAGGGGGGGITIKVGGNPEPVVSDGSSLPQLKAVITQTGDIKTADGRVYTAVNRAVTSTAQVNEIVDEFTQHVFTDPATGTSLRYNLFIPSGYDPSHSYPLLLFMPDASGTGKDTAYTLTQGLGAVVWASAKEQAKHPCFIIAPNFDYTNVDDDWNVSSQVDTVAAVIKETIRNYAIDSGRIYTTGQSGGCMSSIVLMLRNPDLFAGAMLVAGQWDTNVISPLSEQNLWILVCEGDNKATPYMNEAVALWHGKGVTVTEATWPPAASENEQADNAAAMASQNSHIKYTHFIGGSHIYTWQIAYSIEGVRDWLFAQVRTK